MNESRVKTILNLPKEFKIDSLKNVEIALSEWKLKAVSLLKGRGKWRIIACNNTKAWLLEKKKSFDKYSKCEVCNTTIRKGTTRCQMHHLAKVNNNLVSVPSPLSKIKSGMQIAIR